MDPIKGTCFGSPTSLGHKLRLLCFTIFRLPKGSFELSFALDLRIYIHHYSNTFCFGPFCDFGNESKLNQKREVKIKFFHLVTSFFLLQRKRKRTKRLSAHIRLQPWLSKIFQGSQRFQPRIDCSGIFHNDQSLYVLLWVLYRLIK